MNISEDYFVAERKVMVERQLYGRDIRDQRVLEAMGKVPRHQFVPVEHLAYAYADGPLPIGYGQTISQPYIVALMSQLLELSGGEKVLEVGTGSGYQAAVLGLLAHQVYTIERIASLANKAAEILETLGYLNVSTHIGDGSLGLVDFAPYDGIIVTAAAPKAPQTLLDQLSQAGRLIIPVGSRGAQYLEVWERSGDKFHQEETIPVAFVPLVGEYGWRD